MKLCVVFDHIYTHDEHGMVRSPTHYNYDLFARRYLQVFDEVEVISRSTLPRGCKVTLGPGVDFVSAGMWRGTGDFLRKVPALRAFMKSQLNQTDAAMIIAPNRPSELISGWLVEQGIPFGVEVITDPYDVLVKGTINNPLRPLMRMFFCSLLRKVCRQATCVSYVTKEALQKRYPAAAGAYTTNYSSIWLNAEDYASGPKEYSRAKESWNICCLGNMSTMYKGQDTLIEAVSRCRRAGLVVKLTLAGDGKCRPQLEKLVEQLQLTDRVTFLGKLQPGGPIRQLLDESDLYVLPTRGEGLPRTIIEAMSRGLACIGTNVSGVPELLSQECLVPRNDPGALAEKILEMISQPEMMNRAAAENLERSREYAHDLLSARRLEFYQHLREQVEMTQKKAGKLGKAA